MIYMVYYSLYPERPPIDFGLGLATPGERWVRHLDFTWEVETDEPLKEVCKRVRACLTANDWLLVVDPSGRVNGEGWLPQTQWDLLAKKGAIVREP